MKDVIEEQKVAGHTVSFDEPKIQKLSIRQEQFECSGKNSGVKLRKRNMALFRSFRSVVMHGKDQAWYLITSDVGKKWYATLKAFSFYQKGHPPKLIAWKKIWARMGLLFRNC